MSTWIAHYNRPIAADEQRLYDHLLELVQSELPDELIDRFQALFIDGTGYPDAAVLRALDKIAASKSADYEFQFVLNRCCHILINRWQTRPQSQSAIPQLIAAFQVPPKRRSLEVSRSREIRRLRSLVKNFVESEQYIILQRLASVITQPDSGQLPASAAVGALIRRYPYLYEHCLLSEHSSYEQQQSIRDLQAKAQRQYEIDLSQYVTYRVRRADYEQRTAPLDPNRLIVPVKNPTLLNDRELGLALQQFVGKSQGSATYRDVAQRFLTCTDPMQSFQSFKDDLYEYITASVDPEYGRRQFNDQLYSQLKHTLPESDAQKLNDFLLVRTCSQLLNFLVVESPQKPQHFVLVDLIANLGPTLTTGLLLKIVLICRKVKPYLEKRFSILFNHYEACSHDAVLWFVQMMENVNLALSTHFSTIDLSLINRFM